MMHCECEKELTKQSEHSPSTVADVEVLVYALIDPDNATNSDGSLSVKIFSKSKLNEGTLSVCRASLTSGLDAKKNIVEMLLAKNTSRIDCGFLTAPCADIRSVKLGESEVRAICVNDYGLEGFSAHAHLAFSKPNDEKLRNHKEAARATLTALFEASGVSREWNGDPFAGAA